MHIFIFYSVIGVSRVRGLGYFYCAWSLARLVHVKLKAETAWVGLACANTPAATLLMTDGDRFN